MLKRCRILFKKISEYLPLNPYHSKKSLGILWLFEVTAIHVLVVGSNVGATVVVIVAASVILLMRVWEAAFSESSDKEDCCFLHHPMFSSGLDRLPIGV